MAVVPVYLSKEANRSASLALYKRSDFVRDADGAKLLAPRLALTRPTLKQGARERFSAIL